MTDKQSHINLMNWSDIDLTLTQAYMPWDHGHHD